MRNGSQPVLGLGSASPLPSHLALHISQRPERKRERERERERERAPRINGRKRVHKRGHAKTHLFENFPPIPHHSRRSPLFQVVLEILLVVLQNGKDPTLKVLAVEHNVALGCRHPSVLVSCLFLALLDHPGLRISIQIKCQVDSVGAIQFKSSVRSIQSERARESKASTCAPSMEI